MVSLWFSYVFPRPGPGPGASHRATQVLREHQIAVADAAQHAAEAANHGLRVHQRRQVRGDPKPHGVYEMPMRSEMCFFWCGDVMWYMLMRSEMFLFCWCGDVMWCDIYIYVKLDDGWPESVEEQGLLLLVWRHNFTNNIWKMCYRQSRRGVARQNSEKCKTIVCIANTFTHRRFYTQKLLHTEAFTHRSFYTEAITHKAFTHRSFYIQTLLHTDVFTHRRFYTDTFTHRHVYTQTLLHTDLFTHRSCFYTQTLWHTEAFTHRRFYTQALLHTNTFTHKHFYTQTLLHTDAFTRRRLYTQKLLHTNTFTQKHFYTQTLLHTDGFTHKRFYTQSLVHTDAFTQRPAHVLTAKSSLSWRPQQSDGVVWRSPISMCLETSMYKHKPGGLFIEPTFSTFAFFVIDFLPQITVFLHFPESAISLKSMRVLLSGNVKNPSGALVFSSLSGLDSVCSELRQVFVGTVLPPPLPRPNVRPNLAIEQGWIRSTLRMKSLR